MATLVNEEADISSDRLTAEYVTVPQFYSGRSVFITGGTGFMGKVNALFNLYSFAEPAM